MKMEKIFAKMEKFIARCWQGRSLDLEAFRRGHKHGCQADLPGCQMVWPVISSFNITRETDYIVVGKVIQHLSPNS